jgi:hypothetical protein
MIGEGVRAFVDHASGLNDEDAKRVDDRRQAVCDDERRPAFERYALSALFSGS